MKTKKGLFIFMLLISGIHLNAQNFVSATSNQKQLMLEKITVASAQMKSLICDFEQTKELSMLSEKMVSKGKMYYRNDNCLRWEYVSPYVYTFVLNDKKILMQAENSQQNVIDVKSNRFFQEIIKVMLNGISGNGLTDIKSFTVNYYWSENLWRVDLEPLQKEMKKMFSTIKLTFNVKDYSVDKVEMEEQYGDKTIILLQGKQFNKAIENEKFIIN
jgi:outer membrane lipoprotein carrier protein